MTNLFHRADIIIRRVKYYEARRLQTLTFFVGRTAENIAERFAYVQHADAQISKLKAEFAEIPVEIRLKALGWHHWQTHNDGLLEEWAHLDSDRAIMVEYDSTTWRPIACWETKVGMLENLATL
ncbi:hypothetical protein QE320_gp080 [Pseudomonas phage EM]|uniref:Uncharacterized protein n=1 Tax=Pseudomonas phage EM TaxID=2936914 RepID=A0AAE9KT34_9CAUD|nr:hypothetical protein QE320_gp080 [Pseudomonas phage EM]UPW35974.1 hypothetical protein EM_189 [Pseudomonas phage EM]